MKGLARFLILCLLTLGLLSSSLSAQPAAPPVPPGPDPLADLNVAPPVQPGTGGTTPAANPQPSDAWTTLEGMLGRIQGLQREALDAIETHKKSSDETERMMLMRDIQVWHGTIEGMLISSTWKETVEKVRKTDDVTKTKDAPYLGMFGEKGHLPTVDRNQEIIRAFLKDPLAPASTGVSPTAAGPESIAELQRQIDEISLQLAKPDLTETRRGELEAERTRLVERIRQLSAGAAGGTGTAAGGATAFAPPSSTGVADTGLGSTGATGTGTTGRGDAATVAPPPAVPLVPNSYGVAPQVLTDAQIRAALDPLIDKEVAAVNAKSGTGLQMNKYRQMTGSSGKTTVKSVGRPDYDHYREWIKASPTLKAEIDKQAQGIYAERARTLAPRLSAPPPTSTGGIDLPSTSGRDR